MGDNSKLKFFTGKTVKNPFLLIKIKDYIRLRPMIGYKEIFIDPAVYELTEKIQNKLQLEGKYSWEDNLDIKKFLDRLPNNCWFSADYPCDMNLKYTDLFIRKSWINAIKYCLHKRYIITVQSKFNNFDNFKKWFDKYNELPIASGIMGIGNLCRIFHLSKFVKEVLTYSFMNCWHKRIHIYGLGLRCIPFAYELSQIYDIEFSMDSTKWTRAITKELKNKYEGRICCRKHNRQEFFDEYLKVIKNRGVKIYE